MYLKLLAECLMPGKGFLSAVILPRPGIPVLFLKASCGGDFTVACLSQCLINGIGSSFLGLT